MPSGHVAVIVKLMEISKKPTPRAPQLDWRLVRYLVRHMIIGVVSGWIFSASLLVFNIGGLGDLISGSPAGALAAVMLFIVMAITWGSAAMGTAIFLMKEDSHDGGRKAALRPYVRLAPARITARAPRKAG